MTNMRRILSIDGGGIRGIYPATILSELEEMLEFPIYRYFDLVAGTSTGGIIALAISLGIESSKIVEFYEQHGPKIFGGSKIRKWFRHIFKDKYQREPLDDALGEVFGQTLIDDCKTRVVIPSMDMATGKVYLYKTCHSPDFVRDYRKPIREAALATSSAVTYFPNYVNSTQDILTDGGLWANNPTLFAIVDALGILDWSKSDIRVLSIGCIDRPFDENFHKRAGILGFVRSRPVDIFMGMQSESAMSAANTLIGRRNIIRVNDNGDFGIDSVDEIPAMKQMARSQFLKRKDEIIGKFFEAPVQTPFKPYRTFKH